MMPTRMHASEYSTMDTTMALDGDASARVDGRHGRRKNVPAPLFAKMLSIVRRFIVCLPAMSHDLDRPRKPRRRGRETVAERSTAGHAFFADSSLLVLYV